MSIKVCVSGPAGSGKSTVVNELARILDAEIADVGQIFRARAVDAGMTIAEYDKFVEGNPDEDRQMEADFKEKLLANEGNVIASWRLGFHVAPEIPSVWIGVSAEEGARRVFEADRGNQEKKYESVEEAMEANLSRASAYKERLEKIYGVDITDESQYDLVIDSTNKSPEEVLEEVLAFLKN